MMADISKCICYNEKDPISFKFHRNLFFRVRLTKRSGVGLFRSAAKYSNDVFQHLKRQLNLIDLTNDDYFLPYSIDFQLLMTDDHGWTFIEYDNISVNGCDHSFPTAWWYHPLRILIIRYDVIHIFSSPRMRIKITKYSYARVLANLPHTSPWVPGFYGVRKICISNAGTHGHTHQFSQSG